MLQPEYSREKGSAFKAVKGRAEKVLEIPCWNKKWIQ
jgi:hypothetical protein